LVALTVKRKEGKSVVDQARLSFHMRDDARGMSRCNCFSDCLALKKKLHIGALRARGRPTGVLMNERAPKMTK
jgi:hypothetical protein